MKYDIPVSVVMVCENNEDTIGPAIASILNQSFYQFEFIVVNNASTDRTKDVINQYTDPRLKLITLSAKKKKLAATNIAIDYSKGKYLAFMDVTAVALRNRIECQYHYLEQKRHIGCVGTFAEVPDQIDSSFNKITMPTRSNEIKALLLVDNCMLHGTLMLRMGLIKKYRLRFDISFKYYGQYDFNTRCAHLFKVANLNIIGLRFNKKINNRSKGEIVDRVKYINTVRRRGLKRIGISLEKSQEIICLKLLNGDYLFPDEFKESCKVLRRILKVNERHLTYSKNALLSVLENVLEKGFTKSRLGGWSIELFIIEFIIQKIKKGANILEFGAGVGSEALLRNYRLTSIEHNLEFCFNKDDKHTCIHAAIKDGWYDPYPIKSLDLTSFDLFLIDGPVGDLRKGILDHLDLFINIKAPFIFDDADRELDRKVILSFCEQLNLKSEFISSGNKEFAYCYNVEKTSQR
ncbi:glycosyltransferase family 2 protein [Niabella sp.]|uniref:glycosyltransferase family 2 protein n=1 Tax=Niabella sp. TaxID=1962976 RepID=UPI00261E4515|nr:glycosyltransferase family 2 protein [Niabella sp.]